MQRVFREGHEIGNHTFTHPDISEISKRYMMVELNLTERLFEAKLGIKPVLFRPPYSIDQEPDTADEVRPLEIAQQMGYITVGDKIDPNDWRDDPRPTPEQIVQSVMEQVQSRGGGVILLHDGGGNRAQTVAALPGIIRELRARGYPDCAGRHAAGEDLRRCHAAHRPERAFLGARRCDRVLAA